MLARQLILFLLFTLFTSVLQKAFCQVPAISYPTPQVYKINTGITTVLPANSGGAVSASINAQVSTFIGVNYMFGYIDATGNAARLGEPNSIVLDTAGNMYITDVDNFRIRKITQAGVVTTIAGSASVRDFKNGPALSAWFGIMRGLAFDPAGNLFIVDNSNGVVRELSTAGIVSTFVGSGFIGSTDGRGIQVSFDSPTGLVCDKKGNLYMSEFLGSTIVLIAPDGLVTTFAGTTNLRSAIDGYRTKATFYGPVGMAIDKAGNLYIADSGNQLIRKLDTAGMVTTFAGSGKRGSADGLGTAASFYDIYGLTIDNNDNLYTIERFGNRVRRITPAGLVTTITCSTCRKRYLAMPTSPTPTMLRARKCGR